MRLPETKRLFISASITMGILMSTYYPASVLAGNNGIPATLEGKLHQSMSTQKELNAEKMDEDIRVNNYDYDMSIMSLMNVESIMDDFSFDELMQVYEAINEYKEGHQAEEYTGVPFAEIQITGKDIPGSPQSENVKQYGDVSMKRCTIEDICNDAGVPAEDVAAILQKNYPDNRFLVVPEATEYDDAQIMSTALGLSTNSVLVNNLLMVGRGSIGKIPYSNDNAEIVYGDNPSWWVISSNGIRQGMNSCGYIQWLYKNAGFPSDFYDTIDITSIPEDEDNYKNVSKLKVGDLGINGDEIGLYLGNDKWLGCFNSLGTTGIIENTEFGDYYRPKYPGYKKKKEKPEIKYIERIIRETPSGNVIVSENEVSENSLSENMVSENEAQGVLTMPFITIMEGSDIPPEEMDLELMARIVQSEAGGEGINGWVAVAEVVLNRMHSPSYPNDVYGVISAPGQFEGFSRAMEYQVSNPEIKAVCQQVMQGRMGILNNPECVYFQNPSITGYGWDEFNGRLLYARIGNHSFYA